MTQVLYQPLPQPYIENSSTIIWNVHGLTHRHIWSSTKTTEYLVLYKVFDFIIFFYMVVIVLNIWLAFFYNLQVATSSLQSLRPWILLQDYPIPRHGRTFFSDMLESGNLIISYETERISVIWNVCWEFDMLLVEIYFSDLFPMFFCPISPLRSPRAFLVSIGPLTLTSWSSYYKSNSIA